MSNQTITPVREIKQVTRAIAPLPVDTPTTDWLVKQADGADWQLLAFADDGLIWGKIEKGIIFLSGEQFPDISPAWRTETLQEARLFNTDAQIHLWRTDDGWQANRITDGTGKTVAYYDESQILWGNVHQNEKEGFTLVSDGSLGFRHAVPISVDKSKFSRENAKNKRRPLRLKVRHYLTQDDDTGVMIVALSRLVEVEAIE